MEMSATAREIIQRVEELTGKPVEVIADGSLQVLAKVTMARPEVPRHILRLRLDRDVPDYYVAYECGFILRLYASPPAERFQFASTSVGPQEILRLYRDSSDLTRKLRLPDAALRQHSRTLSDGLMTQLRSMPIGMQVDRWIYD